MYDELLSDAGPAVEFAKAGEEVFKRLTVKNYDLIILDVNMPRMNGYKVSEEDLFCGRPAEAAKARVSLGSERY